MMSTFRSTNNPKRRKVAVDRAPATPSEANQVVDLGGEGEEDSETDHGVSVESSPECLRVQPCVVTAPFAASPVAPDQPSFPETAVRDAFLGGRSWDMHRRLALNSRVHPYLPTIENNTGKVILILTYPLTNPTVCA
eukprot:GHVT01091831.1.p2 GENE.GHVT01091831.1~~GHVT01091831.1.p2  ORF type:complete len:137 (-),score=7.51 GHVT01091831.1:931-1341(-)